MKKSINISQAIEAMGIFSEKVDLQILTLTNHLEETDENVETNSNRIDHIEKTVATINYINYKMADLKGELLAMIRAEFKKLKADQTQRKRESNSLIRDKI